MIDMANYRVIPVDTGQCTSYSNLDGEYNDFAPVYHPTLNKIVFASNRDGSNHPDYDNRYPYNIYTADAVDGGSVVRLTTAPDNVLGYDSAAWSPDGERLLAAGILSQNGYSQIYLMPAGGGTPTPITLDAGHHYYPQWLRYLGQ
jgi:Tol biopolymer transport system component